MPAIVDVHPRGFSVPRSAAKGVALIVTPLHLLLVASVLVVPVLASSAQVSPVDSGCNYVRCAVWLDHGKLRRGAGGPVVVHDRFLRPMHLAAFIGGADSATVWAQRFDTRVQTGSRISTLGLVSVALGVGLQYFRVRNRTPGTPDDANGLEATLGFGGAAAFVGGQLVRTSAESFRGRAIWWYNRRFVSKQER